jgi:hypothetical protein
MNKVLKEDSSKCITPSSEPFRKDKCKYIAVHKLMHQNIGKLEIQLYSLRIPELDGKKSALRPGLSNPAQSTHCQKLESAPQSVWMLWRRKVSCALTRNQTPSCNMCQSLYWLLVTIFSKLKCRVFWDVEPCSHIKVERRFILSTAFIITLIMEAVRSSETSVNVNVTTWHYIPKDSNFILATMRT